MYLLAQALSTEAADKVMRQQAGLYLKNILYAKDANTLEANRTKWKALPRDALAQIKQLALSSLNSAEVLARQTGAQVVAEMGAIDLPTGAWPELLPALLSNVTGNTPDEHKVNTLQCLGYTCER